MELISQFADFFIHLDDHLNEIVSNYGQLTYGIVFLIIFCETGLVVTPFLPGDSLLFALGALAAGGPLHIGLLWVLLMVAAILGDTVNYWIGHKLAPKVFAGQQIRFIRMEYLKQTEKFFEKYGGKTIIIARFVPIVRTFAPFMAGVGSMSYPRFITYNVVGALLWVTSLLCAGYFFGNLPFVKKNFEYVILAIIFISLLPPVIEFIKHRNQKQAS